MSRDPWIGTPHYGWADDDDDDDEEDRKKERERWLAGMAAREREMARRIEQRIYEQTAVESLRAAARAEAAARAKLAKEHPALVTSTIVGTALAKLFDGALF